MMPMVPQLKRLMVPLPMMIMVLRVLLIMTMLRAQLLLILMVLQLVMNMVPQQLMMTMVLKVLLIMTMLMKVQLLTLMVPQLMMPMVPQLKKNMVLQLTMMFLPQNTAMLPDADVPDLATLADLPQLDLTETETVQLPEDQLHKPQELEDSSGQLPRHQEDKLVPNNSKHQ